MINPVLNVFLEEAREHLQAMEASLLELDQHPTAPEHIDRLFRAMHTLKGSGGMVGLDHLSYFTHHMESFLDLVRRGDIKLHGKIISLFLDAKDHLEQLIEYQKPPAELMLHSEELLKRLQSLRPDMPESNAPQAPESPPPATREDIGVPALWRIQLQPHANTFADGLDCMPVLRELQSLGESIMFTDTHFPDSMQAFDAEQCYLSFSLLIQTDAGRHAIEDALIFVASEWKIQIDELPVEGEYRLGEWLREKGVIKAEDVDALLNRQPRIGELLQRSGRLKPNDLEQALSEQRFIRKQQARLNTEEQVIRVPVSKLDRLMGLVGELVIVKARLEQIANQSEDEHLHGISEELSRLGVGLRDNAFDIRMLPIGSTFARFRRLIRDLSAELGKDVQFETEGADTELDKMVLDKLTDPLIHLLRNSLDHGIEPPERRVKAGKPARGTIRLSASHMDGQIRIQIEDDGAGLDTERILKKARERNLVAADAELEDKEIFQLIFQPGFSTAETVTDVSGRGVGMDVVRSSIDSLQGRILLDSAPGKGTRTSIYLPMTLAIIEGLMVRVERDHFVLPLSVVEECIETTATLQSRRDGGRLVEHRGRLIPCARLRDSFSIAGQRPIIEQTIVTRAGDQAFGITVDEVIGQYQTVIKNLGPLYKGTPGIMGATITGDGNVAMILDINQLAEDARPDWQQPANCKGALC